MGRTQRRWTPFPGPDVAGASPSHRQRSACVSVCEWSLSAFGQRHARPSFLHYTPCGMKVATFPSSGFIHKLHTPHTCSHRHTTPKKIVRDVPTIHYRLLFFFFFPQHARYEIKVLLLLFGCGGTKIDHLSPICNLPLCVCVCVCKRNHTLIARDFCGEETCTHGIGIF